MYKAVKYKLMSVTSVTLKIISVEAMIALGERIGNNLRGGECIELISDVGGGKTTFVRGLARGAGSTDHVSSPTFTISKVYKAPNFDIVHFDFYRLSETGLIEHEIEEEVLESSSVIVVEWSEIIKHVLPNDRLQINFNTETDDVRILNITLPESYNYLMKGIS